MYVKNNKTFDFTTGHIRVRWRTRVIKDDVNCKKHGLCISEYIIAIILLYMQNQCVNSILDVFNRMRE